MITLFLLSVGFCVYTYALFPVLLHWRARSSSNKAVLEGGGSAVMDSPVKVSIVIAAHNEAGTLPDKFRSLEALSYPAEYLECVFISDGSTDDTAALLTEACARHDNWHCEHYVPAAGKPTALNRGVLKATGDIIVFMDARQKVASDAIQALVAPLANPDIGAVSGELVLVDEMGQEAGNVGLYWRYEKWIRDNESRLFSTTGATGALYAIKRHDYTPLSADTLLDDFDTPVRLLRQGRRTVFEPLAKAYDPVEKEVAGEFARKVRTLAGNFQSFVRHPWLFNPAINPVWWQFLSHKVFRLLVPYALVLALIACLLGDGWFLRAMLICQVAFYALGIFGMAGWRNRISNVVSLFIQLNAAAVLAAYRALRGFNTVRWKSS